MSEGLRVSELDFDGLIAREWLVANGVGGYACSTAIGMNTRRYHGLLVAAMSPPVRRMVLLSRLEETLISDGREHYLACNEYPGVIWPRGYEHIRVFSAEPFPRWAFQGDGWTLEKQVRLLRGENTVLVSYTLLGGATCVELELRPLLALRGMHDLSYQWNGRLQAEPRSRGHWHVAATSRTPEVFFAHDGLFERKPNWYLNSIYRREPERGYPGLEDLWCPGAARIRLLPGQPVYFACSADPFELPQVIAQAGRQFSVPPAVPRERVDSSDGIVSASNGGNSDADNLALLVNAASAFVLSNRQEESLGCTVQYPWSAPSPRAALAGFAGLYLATGRFRDGRALLLSLVPRLEEGLLPSEFPEDGSEPRYEGADVSLWFINAVHQYLAYTGDEQTVRRQLFEPVLRIIDAYRAGTRLGILVDAERLLVSGVAGAAVTWMDARSGDWVVTPRQGRAVEINALWYNASRIAAELARKFECFERSEALSEFARSIQVVFNERFWNESAGCCFDVVGDETADAAVRPNQLLAVSLPYPVLSPERFGAVIDKMRADLLTPRGMRTLSPRDSRYQGYCGGGPAQRDRAYHNGSAFPWLLGPYITAMFRARGRTDTARAEARQALESILAYLRYDGLGQICELFDGDAPHHAGGAIASPLSVGEVLRAFAEDVMGQSLAGGAADGTVSNGFRPTPSPNVPHPA